MNNLYKKQVALLIRIMPSVYRIKDFAVHGGTAYMPTEEELKREIEQQKEFFIEQNKSK